MKIFPSSPPTTGHLPGRPRPARLPEGRERPPLPRVETVFPEHLHSLSSVFRAAGPSRGRDERASARSVFVLCVDRHPVPAALATGGGVEYFGPYRLHGLGAVRGGVGASCKGLFAGWMVGEQGAAPGAGVAAVAQVGAVRLFDGGLLWMWIIMVMMSRRLWKIWKKISRVGGKLLVSSEEFQEEEAFYPPPMFCFCYIGGRPPS